MSRFEEVVNEAIDERRPRRDAARRGARRRTSPSRSASASSGLRAEVTIAARYPETVPTPVSGLPTQEIYTLFGTAVASERGTRTLTGVEAQGMTACPCAQELRRRPRARAPRRRRLHRRRDRARLRAPSPSPPTTSAGSARCTSAARRALDLDDRRPRPAAHRRAVDELGDLRADEALRRGRGGREGAPQPALRRGRRARDDPPGRRAPTPSSRDGGFVLARQENLETIHRHSVVAERSGLLAEILAELETGEHSRHHMTEREWLEAPCADAALDRGLAVGSPARRAPRSPARRSCSSSRLRSPKK